MATFLSWLIVISVEFPGAKERGQSRYNDSLACLGVNDGTDKAKG